MVSWKTTRAGGSNSTTATSGAVTYAYENSLIRDAITTAILAADGEQGIPKALERTFRTHIVCTEPFVAYDVVISMAGSGSAFTTGYDTTSRATLEAYILAAAAGVRTAYSVRQTKHSRYDPTDGKHHVVIERHNAKLWNQKRKRYLDSQAATSEGFYDSELFNTVLLHNANGFPNPTTVDIEQSANIVLEEATNVPKPV